MGVRLYAHVGKVAFEQRSYEVRLFAAAEKLGTFLAVEAQQKDTNKKEPVL